jgi:galactonate dehydratase
MIRRASRGHYLYDKQSTATPERGRTVRITDVQTVIAGNPWKNWVFALVHTDEGLVGLGEGSLNGFGFTVEAGIHELKGLVVGEDPTRIEWLGRRMQRDLYSDGGQIHRAAQAAIEIACWDILGQSVGAPIWQLLGGQVRTRVRAYANGWYRTDRTPEAFAVAAKEAVSTGFTALKFDPFGTAWRQMDNPEQRLVIDIVAAVRDAVGPDVDLMIEAHSRFSVAQALRVAEDLAPFRPTWFEEPVRHDRIGAVGEVARHSAVPIATGESLHTLGEFAELGRSGPIAYWQPEPVHLGGILPTKMVYGMAEAFDTVVAPHQAGGPVATAVCLHLAACSTQHYIQEHFDTFNEPWERDLVSWHPELTEDGMLPIPTGPGLGLTLDIEEALRHPGGSANFLPIFADGWEKRRRDDSVV